MKTAVEFMASELLYLDNEYDMKLINKNEYQAKRKEIIEQAKEMEKEQIMNCCIQTTQDCYIAIMEHLNAPLQFTDEDFSNQKLEAEQYYNKTFKSE